MKGFVVFLITCVVALTMMMYLEFGRGITGWNLVGASMPVEFLCVYLMIRGMEFFDA